MHGRTLRPVPPAMRSGARLFSLVAFATLALAGLASAAPVVPSNFAVDDAAPGAGFVVPTAMAFLPDGRFLVAEKRGRVYEVRGGIKQPTPVLAIENEVLDQHDRGLLGLAVDPRYFVNHFIYVMYTVDPDSNGNDNNDDAFGRLTRYQVNFTDSATVVPGSRTILMGYNWTNGPVSAGDSHTIGALRWGADGSLLATMGDGAQYNYADAGGNAEDAGAFGPGKTDPNEDIGAFRSQDITSLAGKLLRINPANGHGYASNPFVDGNLASPRSRVWAYGLRNPFRFGLRPGTGVADTSAGNPGSIYIGDVGWNSFEEMNVARTGGKNFGWPCYEGLSGNSQYQALNPPHNGCGSFGTATNPSSPTAPTTSWSHGIQSLSDPQGFTGNTSIGGQFYTSNQYPAQYRGQYFFADYGQNWIKVCVMDANDNRLQLLDFMSSADGPVDLAVNPVGGDVYYVSILTGQVRRIRYTGAVGGNTPPVAAVSAVPTVGAAPLNVAFSASGSLDADGDPLTYSWLFGDGTGGTGITTSHLYTTFGLMSAQLTVADNKGGIDVKPVQISVSPPGTGFPTTNILDNFNRADGPVGSNWLDQSAGLTIASNVLTSTVVSNTTVWNGGPFGKNQEAYFSIANPGPTTEENLMLKVQGTTWSTGHIECRYDAVAGRVYVNTYAPTQGFVARGSFSVSYGAGDQFGARADSIGNVAIYKNGTSLGQVSTGDWPFGANTGRIGVTLSNLNTTGATVDNFGGGTVVVSTNSKPAVTILQPLDNSFFYTGQVVNLVGTGVDAETPSNQLTYNWTADLYHNTHIHPNVFYLSGASNSFIGENDDDGTGVHMQVKFTATDPQGYVSDTARVNLWPEIDLQPGPVTIIPDPPVATQSAQYSFMVRNAGRMPAPFSRWILRAGNTVLAQRDTIIPPLDSIAFVVNATIPGTGPTTLRLTVDTLQAVFETQEGNNAFVRALNVGGVPGNHTPVPAISANPTSGNAPLPVTFSAAGSTDQDGDPLTYAWAFGDGGTATGVTPAPHTYAVAGSYNATVTVDDGKGGVASTGATITVSPPPNTFPQTAVLDNFNRANGAIGGSWVGDLTGLTISNNQLAQTTSDNSVVWNGATFGAWQEVYLTFSAINVTAPEQNLMLKVQGTSWSSGIIEVAYNAAQSRVVINTYAPTQGWVGRGTITPVSFVAGDRFGARCDATGSVEVYRNTTKVGTISVGNWPFAASGGRLGLYLSSSAGNLYDDFGGGTVTGTPLPQPDLQVSAVTVTPDPAIATQSAQYGFKIYNRGLANAATSHWMLVANTTLLGQGDVAINTGDSAAVNVNATLATTGTYTVRLTADSLGAVSESNETNNSSVRSLTVNPVPGNHAPVAVAGGTPQSGQAPLNVSFSGAGSSDVDGDPLTYAWAFGDGGTGSGLNVNHSYTTAGTYAAILTVSDGRGGSDTASVPVTVTPAPVTFPLTAVLDNFNRANGSVGAPWTPTTGLTISSNQLKPSVNDVSTVWNGAVFGPNQEAYLRLNAITANSPEHDLNLKMQSTVWSAGLIEIAYNNQKKTVGVSTYDPAVGWVGRGSVSATFVAGDQFGARALSNGTVTVYKNGVVISTFSAAGWAFNASGGRLGLAFTRATSSLMDDFGGGDVPGPAPSAALDRTRDAEAAATLPGRLALSSPFPNPMRGTMSLALDLPTASPVGFSIFDVQGRQVWQAAERDYLAGRWMLQWDGIGERGPVPAGLYLARVRVGAETFMRRLAVVR